MKKFLLVLCMALCILGLTGCNKSGVDEKKSNYDEETLSDNFESILEAWNSSDFDTEIDTYEKMGEEDIAAIWTSWKELYEKLGTLESIGDISVSETDGNIIVSAKCVYSKRSMEFSVDFGDLSTGTIYPSDISAELILTFGEKLEKAGMNTLMGMGTVFVVLIFISFIIGFLKYIPIIVEKLSAKNKEVISEVVKDESSSSSDNEEVLTDDTELVAVITAAIMASMGDSAPADGLVVRSIRKVNKNKWQNA